LKAETNIKADDYTGDEGLKKYIFEKLIGKNHSPKPTDEQQDTGGKPK